jgi:hypothetical protein
MHASRVTVDDEDTAERMTLTNHQGHPVATFQASGR